MFYPEELTLQKTIIHILDPSISMPILSEKEIESGIEAGEYFSSHIIKTLNDDGLKMCTFDDDYNMFYAYLKELIQDESKFVNFSRNIAELLYQMIASHENILPCDLAVCLFHYKGVAYLALLKMNYQSAYIHYTDDQGNVNVNTIMQHYTTLPGINQRVQEAIIINLANEEVSVLEKVIEIEGAKENYLSKRFLKCRTKLSSKEQYNIVKKATDAVTKAYFDEDVEKKMTLKQELFETLEESGSIDLQQFANQAFNTHVEAKEAFFEAIEKKGLEEPVIQLTEKTIARTFEKQRIKTDSGIEIKIPMAMYNNPENMELKVGDDGKVSIVLKNIGKIIG